MELNTEQKQRINLSLHAQDVLTIDREQFAPQLTSSGFINELLFRYAPQAEASVTENLERRRKNILMQLSRAGRAGPQVGSFPPGDLCDLQAEQSEQGPVL